MKDFIEKLINYDGNHYELSVAASKRAAYLVNKNIISNTFDKPAVKALYDILSKDVEVIDTSKIVESEEE
ncbi:MAG: DNA-directed RNA polymerase subunit omega [Brevinematales bacterium]|nr:DNA-directed RNA polymerase subunit omega [Brevinematales bacterium]